MVISHGDSTKAALCGAFLIAFLLTRDSEQTESAILDAIDSSDAEATAGHEFVLRAATAALAAQTETGGSRLPLPEELQDVLRLSARYRHCFVLRALAGMSREECAGILNVDASFVDEHTRLAFIELAEFRSQSKGASVQAPMAIRGRGRTDHSE